MARDHVRAVLDELVAQDADAIAADAVAFASSRLTDVPGEFKAAVVVADDLMGGWTNRYDCEFAVCRPLNLPPRFFFKDSAILPVVVVTFSWSVASSKVLLICSIAVAACGVFLARFAAVHGVARNRRPRSEEA